MILPDLNLLFHAYNPHAATYPQTRDWWGSIANGDELIGFPHEILFGFTRIATNPNLGDAAFSLSDADRVVASWLEFPHARILLPDPAHYGRVIQLMNESKSVGRVLSDAVLASYAIANRATLCSTDSDFARFQDLDWTNPLA